MSEATMVVVVAALLGGTLVYLTGWLVLYLTGWFVTPRRCPPCRKGYHSHHQGGSCWVEIGTRGVACECGRR